MLKAKRELKPDVLQWALMILPLREEQLPSRVSMRFLRTVDSPQALFKRHMPRKDLFQEPHSKDLYRGRLEQHSLHSPLAFLPNHPCQTQLVWQLFHVQRPGCPRMPMAIKRPLPTKSWSSLPRSEEYCLTLGRLRQSVRLA